MTANIYFPALPTLSQAFHESTENLVGLTVMRHIQLPVHHISATVALGLMIVVSAIADTLLQNLTVTMYMVMQGIGKFAAIYEVSMAPTLH